MKKHSVADAASMRSLKRHEDQGSDWEQRIFKFDGLACGKCGGRMKVLAVIEEPVIEKVLRHMGLPHLPLPTSPSRGQRAFDFLAA